MKKRIFNLLVSVMLVVALVGTSAVNIQASNSVARGIKNASVSSVSNKVYTGKRIKPTITVKYNSKKLVKGTDYTVTYGTNKNIGKGTITIKGKGKYTGSKKITFKIVPKKPAFSSKSAKKTSIYLKWTKPAGAAKYQVAYRRSGNSTYKNKTTSNNYITLSDLASGKYYQIKVRAYKVVNGTKYYSAWSPIKEVKTLKSSSSSSNGSTQVTSNYVWISETGSKYHKINNCGRMNPDKAQKVTKSKAQSLGLDACDKCF